MIRTVSILGSTGSIGTQTLDVCRRLNINVVALTAGRNLDLLEEQVREFHPEVVSVQKDADAITLRSRLADIQPPVTVLHGREGNLVAATMPDAEMVVAAMVGFAGLEPVLAATRDGKKIALANKETLVSGGSLVTSIAAQTGAKLYPVDSEHSAIWQCLLASPPGSMSRILLTASGGPFRGCVVDDLQDVSVDQALNHPTWAMGRKISIDSATLMNKGLEVIEAKWLFDCSVDQIEVVVHPQSIIHSMVEFKDGSILAQMGVSDMKLPIQFALTWPERVSTNQRHFNPFGPKSSSLTFEKPDRKTFRSLDLAYQAARLGGTMPAVLNAANEAAVELFLSGQIKFLDIANRVEKCMERHQADGSLINYSFEDLVELDRWARAMVTSKSERSKVMIYLSRH